MGLGTEWCLGITGSASQGNQASRESNDGTDKPGSSSESDAEKPDAGKSGEADRNEGKEEGQSSAQAWIGESQSQDEDGPESSKGINWAVIVILVLVALVGTGAATAAFLLKKPKKE